MSSLFGEVLREEIARHGWSVNRFAGTVGCAQGHVSAVIAAKKRPSITMARRWADVLGMKGEDRTRFLRLAAICHVPAEMQQDLAGLVERERSAGR